MSRWLSHLVLALMLSAAGLAGARTVPQEIMRVVPDAALAGNSRLTYMCFKVYEASLWVATAFAVS
jgi:hypothetical protein